VVEPKTNSQFKSKIHPYFAFPFKDRYIISEFDMTSGWKAKENNDPNSMFAQLIRGGDRSLEELEIYRWIQIFS